MLTVYAQCVKEKGKNVVFKKKAIKLKAKKHDSKKFGTVKF